MLQPEIWQGTSPLPVIAVCSPASTATAPVLKSRRPIMFKFTTVDTKCSTRYEAASRCASDAMASAQSALRTGIATTRTNTPAATALNTKGRRRRGGRRFIEEVEEETRSVRDLIESKAYQCENSPTALQGEHNEKGSRIDIRKHVMEKRTSRLGMNHVPRTTRTTRAFSQMSMSS